VIEPTPLPGRLFAYFDDAGQDDEDEDQLEAPDLAPRATAEHAARVACYARLVERRGWIWDNTPPVSIAALVPALEAHAAHAGAGPIVTTTR
jgi:hypothetical protein